MDLEGDLGIDSIKQVEILFALRKRMPHLPEIEPSQISQLRTLSKIAAHLSLSAGGAADTLCRQQSE
jgi:acyl carrier protein